MHAVPGGQVVRVRDIARVELGAQDYTVNAYLNNKTATALVIFQKRGSNALATAAAVKAKMEELKKDFPPGVGYSVVYNATEFIQFSVDAVIRTLAEAIVLVALVVIMFLQTWRAAIIPILAIPVSLIGTFFIISWSASRSTRCRYLDSCWRLASLSTTPSSLSKTWSAI